MSSSLDLNPHPMQFHIITIFPELFTSPLSVSLLKKAQDRGVVSCVVHNLRDYAIGKHRSTDDTPYGGGRGMVVKPEPVVTALEGVCDLSLSPGGFSSPLRGHCSRRQKWPN